MTVIASLAAILLVPSPAFRGTALGIILAVAAVLAATLTLLPAVLARLGTRINDGPADRAPITAKAGHLDGPPGRLGPLLWRHPLAAGLAALGLLFLAALPVLGLRDRHALHHRRAARRQRGAGLRPDHQGLRPGAPGVLQVLVPAHRQTAALAVLAHQPGLAATTAGPTRRHLALDQVVPATGPSTAATGATIDRLRHVLPPAASWAAPPLRTTTSSVP